MSSLIKGMKVYLVEPIDDINQLKNQFQPYIDAGLDLSVGPYVSERNKGFSEQDRIRIGNEYDAVIGMSREKFTRDIIMASDRLKMIGKTGIGIDHIDVNAAKMCIRDSREGWRTGVQTRQIPRAAQDRIKQA